MVSEDLAASAMHWRRQRCIVAIGVKRAPHRAASPMHRRCGAILRPPLFRPHLGGLDRSISSTDGSVN
eukprot:3672056-Pyramimonas_sp.AAC.1